jgi:hypothetical protein
MITNDKYLLKIRDKEEIPTTSLAANVNSNKQPETETARVTEGFQQAINWKPSSPKDSESRG